MEGARKNNNKQNHLLFGMTMEAKSRFTCYKARHEMTPKSYVEITNKETGKKNWNRR